MDFKMRQWCAEIFSKQINANEKKLIKLLVKEILENWKIKASHIAYGYDTSPADEFDRLYFDNKDKAQGAIYAIVELVRDISKGEFKIEQFKEWD